MPRRTLSIGMLGIAAAAAIHDFASPPAIARPKFRYWIPDASIPLDIVAEDVKSIGHVGAGGLQLVPFYNYGLGPPLTDWDEYGFGLPAYQKALEKTLEVCVGEGLLLDYSMGPNQGQGVPSETQTEGLAKELVYENITVAGGDMFTGPIPEPVVDFNALDGFLNENELWGDNTFLAAVASKLIAEVPLAEQYSMGILDETSTVDLTSQVQNGRLEWTAPAGNTTWRLFFFYERFTLQRACVSGRSPQSRIQNGSWVVDHFSPAGATKISHFWEQNLLNKVSIDELLKKTAQSSWEDSMELQASLWWTPGLAERFHEHHNYSLVTSLPVLFHAANQWGGYLPPYNVTYTYGAYNPTAVHEDYWYTLTQLYKEYLGALQSWSASRGLNHSTQPAYNLPMDMSASIPSVGVPELESLGFGESLDKYRQFTGAAHLNGIRLISTEIGAVRSGAWTQTIPSLVDLTAGSLAVGVNRMVYHGYAYSGTYPNTTWPGYTPFNYEFTDMWNPRQPCWPYMNDTMAYAGRNSYILQRGTPKIDLGFYYHSVPWNQGSDIYIGQDLNNAGYTHEYFGVENLESLQASTTQHGVFAPEGPAYRALILYNQTQITPAASKNLVNLATQGQPIIIFGSPPNRTIGANGQEEVSKNMETLVEADNTFTYGLDQSMSELLTEINIKPRVQVRDGSSDASQLYTFLVEEVDSSGTSFVYMNNRGQDGTFTLSFEVPEGSTPYVMDAWTGRQRELRVFKQTGSSTTLHVTLKTSQTCVLMFVPPSVDENNDNQSSFFTMASDNIFDVQRREQDGRDIALVKTDATGWLTLSTSGKNVSVPAAAASATIPDSIDITSWDLLFFSHQPQPDDLTIFEGEVEEISLGRIDSLAPWTEIAGIEHRSGMGRYTGNFTASSPLPTYPYDDDDGNDGMGLTTLLSLGPVLHTMRVWVNGVKADPIDVFDSVLDITDLVHAGENDVVVEVAGTMFNAVKQRVDDIWSAAGPVSDKSKFEDADWAEFGLIGPVKVQFLRRVALDY